MMSILDPDHMKKSLTLEAPVGDKIAHENRQRAKSLIKIDTDSHGYVPHSTLLRPITGRSETTRNEDLRAMSLIKL